VPYNFTCDGNPRITRTSTCFFDKKCVHSLHEHTSLHFTAVKADTFTGYLHLYWQNQPACTLAVHQFSMRPSLPQTMSPNAPIAVITAPRSTIEARAHTIRGSLWILRHMDMKRAEVLVSSRFEKAAHRHPKIRFDPTCFLIKSVYLHTICKILNCGIPAANYTAQKLLPIFQSQLVKKKVSRHVHFLPNHHASSKRPLPQTLPRRRKKKTLPPRSAKLINCTHTYTQWITSI
jgi:hypothetical protein